MKKLPTKSQLRDELCALIRADLETLERAHLATREAATHEEARPEDDKDTRALEQSYLARGQAMRVEELGAGLLAVQHMSTHALTDGAPIAVGALVHVEEEDVGRFVYFIAPYGGGTRLAGGRVQAVTPQSPLGKALVEKRAGDDCEVFVGERARYLTIEEVR